MPVYWILMVYLMPVYWILVDYLMLVDYLIRVVDLKQLD
jgi:hypothetical protein